MADENKNIDVRKQEDLAVAIGNADVLLNKSYLSLLNTVTSLSRMFSLLFRTICVTSKKRTSLLKSSIISVLSENKGNCSVICAVFNNER